MILADKRDYKKGYKKHYDTYRKIVQTGAVLSKKLLLVYAVECGLKYKLLEKWEINVLGEIREILADKKNPRHNILGTHNLRKLIKELGQEGQFHFPQIKTKHQDNVSTEEYHQLLRYGIDVDSKDVKKEEELEEVLQNIAAWIQEEI